MPKYGKSITLEIEKLIKDNLDNAAYDSRKIAKTLNLSRSQFYRKVKKETGLSPSIFIRKIRLDSAAQLLIESSFNISEIAYRVGFENPNNFSKYFKELYKTSPTQYRQNAVDHSVSTYEEKHDKDIIPKKNKIYRIAVALTASVLTIIIISKEILGKKSSLLNIKDVPLAVLKFENHTQDSLLDIYGYMAMDWISTGLMQVEGLTVIKVNETELTSANRDYFLNEGAGAYVKGRYYKNDVGKLYVSADLINAESGEILYTIPLVENKEEDAIESFVHIQQKLLGFYELEDEYVGLRPPRLDAYRSYIKGVTEEATFPYTENLKYLTRAIKLDSLFLEPHFATYALVHWTDLTHIKKKALTALESKKHYMSEYQKLRYDAIVAMNAGNQEKAAEIEWKLYQNYKKPENAERAIYEYRFSNNLNKTIACYREARSKYNDTIGSYSFAHYLGAMYETGDYNNVELEIKQFPRENNVMTVPLYDLRVSIRKNDLDAFDKKLKNYLDKNLVFEGYYSDAFFLNSLLMEMYLLKRTKFLDRYLPVQNEWLSQTKNSVTIFIDRARYYYMTGEYKKMYENAIAFSEQSNYYYFSELAGVALIKMGKFKEAQDYMDKLKSINTYFPGSIDYALAVMQSYSDKETSIPLFKKAIDKGYEFDWYCYRNDIVLEHMINYQPFIEITQPK